VLASAIGIVGMGLAARTLPRLGVDPDEPLFVVIRHWPNRASPSPQARALVEESVVGVDRSQAVPVLDLGTVRQFTAVLERRGLLTAP